MCRSWRSFWRRRRSPALRLLCRIVCTSLSKGVRVWSFFFFSSCVSGVPVRNATDGLQSVPSLFSRDVPRPTRLPPVTNQRVLAVGLVLSNYLRRQCHTGRSYVSVGDDHGGPPENASSEWASSESTRQKNGGAGGRVATECHTSCTHLSPQSHHESHCAEYADNGNIDAGSSPTAMISPERQCSTGRANITQLFVQDATTHVSNSSDSTKTTVHCQHVRIVQLL